VPPVIVGSLPQLELLYRELFKKSRDIVVRLENLGCRDYNSVCPGYGGDTGNFNIQSGTVDEGSFALEGTASTTQRIIVRDIEQDAWGPPIRMTWRQYITSSTGDGGIVWGAQSVAGVSSVSCYTSYSNASTGLRIDKITNGSIDSGAVASTSSASISEGSWIDGVLEWQEDGTMTLTLDGNTITGEDTDYTEGFLGFLAYDELRYIDNVKFKRI